MTAGARPPPDVGGLGAAPLPQEFAQQLIHQLCADLDGVLFEGEAAVDRAFDLLCAEAAQGSARGAVLAILARAALAAHRSLVHGDEENLESVHEADAGELLAHLVPGVEVRIAQLLRAGAAIEHYVLRAENGASPLRRSLAEAVVRLYDGLRAGDEARGPRGLVELRSRIVHLDAAAQWLIVHPQANAVRLQRPDRFHDLFLRFVERARGTDAKGEARAIAALSRDGRIAAVIAEDAEHPVAAAVRELHQQWSPGGNDRDIDGAEQVLMRVRALLEFFGMLRRKPPPALGSALDEPLVYTSLVLAGATAPLEVGEAFDFAPMAQIARFNQTLLRTPAATRRQSH